MVSIGFAKQDLEAALRPLQPVREERIEAISLYAADDLRECIWIVLDFMDFDLHTVRTLAEAVYQETKIPEEHIHIVTTHNHGGGTPDLSVLASLSAACAGRAMACAKPARMRFTTAACQKQVSMIRRKYIPEIEGVTTLFYGANAAEGFDASVFIENALQSIMEGDVSYCGRRETVRPYDPFLPGDDTVFVAQFCDATGETIGSVVRFAAHAVCCNRPGSFSSDYPYHVRAVMQQALGGTALFFNGPCGDIAPGMVDKYDDSQRVLGEYIGKVALSAIENSPWVEIESFFDVSQTVSLVVRDSVKNNSVDTTLPVPEELSQRFRSLERRKHAEQLVFLRDKYRLGEKEPDGTVRVSIGALKLGELIIAAFPGETFSETGAAVREAFPECTVCTVTEHGRTAMYMPPEKECEKGGYENTCRMIKCGEEAVSREKMMELLAGLTDDAER